MRAWTFPKSATAKEQAPKQVIATVSYLSPTIKTVRLDQWGYMSVLIFAMTLACEKSSQNMQPLTTDQEHAIAFHIRGTLTTPAGYAMYKLLLPL